MSTQKTGVMMSLPCFMRVLCMTRYTQIHRIRILVILVHGINKQEEYCPLLKFWPPNINLMHIRHDKCGRNQPGLSHCPVNRINETASWMALKSSKIQDCSWWINTILKYVVVPSFSCHALLPLVVKPVNRVREMFLMFFWFPANSLLCGFALGFYRQEFLACWCSHSSQTCLCSQT